MIYFLTRDHKSQESPELVIPLSAHQDVSPAMIHQVLTLWAEDCDRKEYVFSTSSPTVLLSNYLKDIFII